jgi:hypothetical protein
VNQAIRVNPLLDYAAVPVGPVPRYSGAVIASFILALLLPVAVVDAGFPRIAALPAWLVLSIPLSVFVVNFAAALRLLESPYHLRGDGLVAAGTFISGVITLIAIFYALMIRM